MASEGSRLSVTGSSPQDSSSIQIKEAKEALDSGAVGSGTVLLLYLNADTFRDGEGAVAAVARSFLPFVRTHQSMLVLVHEKDASKGGCPFHCIMENTPDDLLKQHHIFNTVAVPLYTWPAHREVSLRHALRCIWD